jgi:hypothetical protein
MNEQSIPEQSIPEQPVELTEKTDEKLAESVVDIPRQSPVKRVVRKSVEKTIAPTIDTTLEVSDQTPAEASIEKLDDSPVPEANVAEPAPFVPVQSAPAPALLVQAIQAQPAEFKPAPFVPDPRRRLRELLAIPDRDRTDALWDELIELEIQLAPGNRVQSPNADLNGGRHQKPSRFSEPARRPASSPNNSGRHHRPNPAHGSAPNAGPGGPGVAATYGAGGADTPRPAKRFFKKPRRGPRPPDKV